MELIEKFKEKKGNELRKKSLYVKSMIREKHKVSVLHDEFNTILSDTIDELYGCLPGLEDTTTESCLASKAPNPAPHPEEIGFFNGREDVIEGFKANLQKLIEEK
jgi:hypothetical protein